MLWNCSFPEATTRSFIESRAHGLASSVEAVDHCVCWSAGLLTLIWTLTFYLDSPFNLGFIAQTVVTRR
jgi:hypothetical protein